MGIYLLDVYRSPNVGIFVKASDKFLLLPKGLANSKAEKLSSFLGTEAVRASVGGLRLLGPLVTMNNKGILVSRLMEDEEIKEIKRKTGLPVERVSAKYTSIGNLIVANDHGALVSGLFTDIIKQVVDVLDILAEVGSVASYHQVGSMVVATNTGVVVHPRASEAEVEMLHDLFKVDVEPSTINGGVPYVASGLVANAKNAVVGTLTTGPELYILSRALKV